MAKTQVRTAQVEDGGITRADLNTATVGSAVITKLVQGSNLGLSLSSTGADAGTGDVTPSLAGYASGVAPGVLAGVDFVAQKTGVDLKTNAVTDIFTVPAGRTFVCTGGFVVPTTVVGGAAVAFAFKIIESGAAGLLTTAGAAASAAPVTSKVWVQLPTPGNSPFAVCAAGAKVQISITAGFTTSTTVTGTVFVTGFYVT